MRAGTKRHFGVSFRGLRRRLAAAALALVSLTPGLSHATTFTMTTPNGIALPSAYPQAGGVAIVMVGVNGNVYYQFSDPAGAFVGYQNTGDPAAFRGNPFTINNPITLNCGFRSCTDYFGGAIAQIYIRFSALDGDTASGDFDFNRITLRMNGFDVGNWSSVQTERTNTAGTTSQGFQTGFGNNTFNTGWFTSTNSALLSNILTTGRTTTQVFDSTPNDNYWDFRQGNSLSNPELRSIAPGYEITKSANRTTFTAVGQTINYTYTITNIGSVNITNLALADDKIPGVTCNKTTIVRSITGGTPDVATCTATYTVTQADVDAGRVTNVARATGTPDFGVLGAVTATATVTGPTAAASLQLTKSSTATAFGNAGSTVPYRFTLRNTGNVTLTNVVVTDPLIPSLSCTIATLAPNATASCNATYTVTQANVDAWASGTRLANTATANARTPSGTNVQTTGTLSLPGPGSAPALTVQKTSPATTYAAVGDVLNFSIRVTNTGNVTFPSAPAISDPLVTGAGGTVSCPAGAVAPGASVTCTASYTVTQANIDARSVTNVATASVTVGGVTATGSGQVTLNATVNPALTILKRLAAGSPATFDATEVGLTYEYVLTNTGNVTLNAPAVTDNRVAVTCPATPIAPGSSVTCTSAVYETTQADLDAGGVTNTASASATPQGSTTAITSAAPSSVTVPSVRSPSFSIDKTAPNVSSSSFAPGLVVTYTYAVTNTGNVTATSQITVTDNRIGAPFNCGSPPYAPGAVVTCSANYTVTAADVTAGLVQNTASASDGTTTSNTDSATIPQAGTPALTLAKSASPATFDSLSDTITYTFTVTNSGDTNLVNPGQPVTITDPKLSGITCSQPATLAPGASFTCTGTYSAITQAELDAGEIVNSATASFVFNTPGGPVTITSPSASATVTSDAVPAFTVAKTGPADFATVGQTLTYNFLITNTGSQTLTTVTVTDPLIPALSCTRTNIAPNGGTATCSGDYTVTQADIDAEEIVNTASATGSTGAGGTATATDSVTTPIAAGAATRAMSVAKTVSPTSFTAVGQTLTFTIAVTNTGTQTLTGIAVGDALVPGYTCTIGSLAPGATDTTCTLAYTVTQADVDAGAVVNSATATAQGAQPASGSTTATGPAAAPALDLTKTALGTYAAVGDTVTFRMTVRNAGNVTLTGVTVSDTFFTPDLTCTLGTLAPGATDTSCIGTYTVTQADIDAGSITNTASVTGTQPGGGTTSDTATATVTGPADAPSMTVSKSESGGGGSFGGVGSTETFTFEVTNTGPVTLTGVTISDPLTGFSCTLDDIAPDATATTCAGGAPLSATYTITQADIDRGFLTNSVSASGESPRGTPVSATDSVTLSGPQQAPALSLAKSVTSGAGFDAPGDAIAYSYVVTNTGNFTLTAPVTVTDNRIASVACPALPPGGLAPGASVTCSGTYLVTQADIDVGSVTNDATARVSQPVFGSPDPVVATAADSETVSAAQAPAMTLDKRVLAGSPTTFDAVGDQITYQFLVRNTGNTTIPGPIQVNDPLLGGAVSCLPGPLAPGAQSTCQAIYTVTQADLDAGSVANTATAFTGPAGSPTLQSPPDSVTVPALQDPAIDFGKSTTQTAATDFFLGNTITYTYTLTNSGNVSLPGPFEVQDNFTSPVCPAGPLAPGDTLSCTGTHVITTNDIALGRITNNARPVAEFNGSPVPANTASVTIPGGSSPALTVTKTETSGAALTAAGQVLTYEYFVQNTGDAALASDVEVFDDRISGAILCHDSQGGTVTFNTVGSGIAPFEATCTATYTVTQADMDRGFVTNTAFAQSIFAPASPTPLTVQSPAVEETVSAAAAPALAVTKTVTAGPNPADAGDTLTYAITTTNAGNQTVSGLTVSDPLIPALSCDIGGAPTALPASLAPAAALVCTGTYTVTQADVDAQALTNTATAEGSSPQGAPVSAAGSVSHPLVAANPSMTVAKAVTDPTTTPPYGGPGEQVTFGVTVTNTGEVTLTTVTVTDSLVAGACTIGPLAPGASDASCSFVYTVTQADIDAGAITNTASAAAQPANPGGAPFTVTDTLVTAGPAAEPAFSVVKTADLVAIAAPGQIVTYTYTVSNIGNVTITADPSVTDDRIGTFACGSAPIAPLSSVTCTATYTVTQADIDAGGVTNTATAAAAGVPESEPVSLTIPATQTGGLDVVKTVTGNSGLAAGDTVDFQIAVANTGNVSLTAVTLTDTLTRADGTVIALTSGPSLASGDGGTAGSLDVGETWIYTAQATLTQADLDAGGIRNTATVTANQPDGTPISDVSDDGDDADGNTTDDPTEFLIAPNAAATVDKTILVAADQLFPTVWSVSFAIEVANTGNLTLTGFQVTDDLAAFASPATLLASQYPVSVSVSGFASASANPGYDGDTDINLLAPGASLAPGETGRIEIDLVYSTATGFPSGANSATASSPVLPAPVTGSVTVGSGDTDGDGIPDGVEGCGAGDDRDGDGICDAEDFDPTGYFYCQEDGRILPGGSITVTGPLGSQTGVGTSNNITIVRDGSDGSYIFFVSAPGRYTLVPTYPTFGTASATRVPTSVPVDVTGFGADPAVLGSSESGTSGRLADFSEGANTPSYLVFDIEAGDPTVISNNLALEACATSTPIAATKTADRSVVRRGDAVNFTLTFTNGTTTALTGVSLVDLLPSGLTYTPGSGTLNGVATEPGVDGRRIAWTGVTIAPGETATATLTTRVSGEAMGRIENRGWIEDPAGSILSNIARATIRVEPEHVFDCSDVIGKVFDDRNMNGYQDGPASAGVAPIIDDDFIAAGKFGKADPVVAPDAPTAGGEPGLPGVRVVTTRGLIITTDEYGRFHVPCAELPSDIGSNFTLKLDTRSLPSGYRVTTENPRTIRLTAGKMAKLNFGAAIANVVDVDLTAAAFVSGTATPKPALKQGVTALVDRMRDRPSVIRLDYLQGSEARKTAHARLDAVEALLREAWRGRGRYKLNIERTIRRVQ